MKARDIVFTMLGIVCRVAIAIALVYAIYRGATMSYDYGYRIFTEPPVTEGEKGKVETVAITKDMSPSDIGNMLEQKGLVRDGRLFSIQYRLSEYKDDVKPGIYEFSSAMTAEEMMEVMTGVYNDVPETGASSEEAAEEIPMLENEEDGSAGEENGTGE